MPLPPPNQYQQEYGDVKKLSQLRVKESPISGTPTVVNTAGGRPPTGQAPQRAVSGLPAASPGQEEPPIPREHLTLMEEQIKARLLFEELDFMASSPTAGDVIKTMRDIAWKRLMSISEEAYIQLPNFED